MVCNLLQPCWDLCASRRRANCTAVLFTQFTSAGLDKTEISFSASMTKCLWSMFCLLFGNDLSFVNVLQLEGCLGLFSEVWNLNFLN